MRDMDEKPGARLQLDVRRLEQANRDLETRVESLEKGQELLMGLVEKLGQAAGLLPTTELRP